MADTMLQENSTLEEVEDRLGMTDDQWAQWQAYTHGYGEQDENGVDISLIRENLRFSPWERLRKLQRNSTFFKENRMNVTQVDDFQQIIAVLTAASLRFVIVGGVAMRLQGSAHLTDDIDFAVARDPENLEAAIKALAPYHPALRGAPPGLPFFWEVRTLRNIMNITLRTDLGSVDLFGELAGAGSFEQLWNDATLLDLDGVPVRVASIRSLIAMKRAAGRPKDLSHLMELEQMQKQIEAS
jgi:predicted nucleotidyltransferase